MVRQGFLDSLYTHCMGWTARLLSLLVLVLAVPGTLEAQKTVTVRQGELARWDGDATTSCGMDGRTWKPVEGTCWYPVDFARQPGKIEIARWYPGGMESGWLTIEEREFETQDIEFPDDTFVNLSEENLARHYGEQAAVKPLFRRRGGEPRFTLPLGEPANAPLPEGRYFGVKRNFNGEPKNPHTGIDYAIGLDNPAKAVADGTVVLIGDHFFSGKSVYVYHGNGLISMYFHLNDFKAEVGQEVQRGDEIALIGSSGRSTGPHLHLGLRWNGARIDPNLLLDDIGKVPTVE